MNQPIPFSKPHRHRSLQARVSWGDHVVTVGGDAPVRVQSMTNTDTGDAIGTAIQVKELALAGSELVRITVDTPESAKAVPYIREQLDICIGQQSFCKRLTLRALLRVAIA